LSARSSLRLSLVSTFRPAASPHSTLRAFKALAFSKSVSRPALRHAPGIVTAKAPRRHRPLLRAEARAGAC